MSGPLEGMAAALPLPERVRNVRDKYLALLRESDPAAADWVERVRRSRPETPSVVVVGETNRGKSSLVNALIGQHGLSPVDVEVATATYLRFEYGTEWAGYACSPGQEAVPFAVAELANWVSVAGVLPEGQRPPRFVRVAAPIENLARVSVVDTPGAGGLERLHGELAREAALAATALLFVTDASAPLTRGELDFLHDIGDRVETVLFVMTKTDQFRGWRQILEADQQLLAEHAPRFADTSIAPVSARLHELAESAPNPQASELLRTRSGIDQLRSGLESLIAGQGAMLSAANTLRALSTVLDEWAVRLEARQRALTVGEQEAETLRARRGELSTARRSSTRGWQVKLRGEIQRTRVETGHEVTRQLRGVQNWFRKSIDTADRGTLDELPQQVDLALQMASTRVAEMLSTRLDAVVEHVLAELFHAEELAVLRAQFAKGTRAPVALRPPEKRPSTAEDKLLMFMGVSGGVGLGRAALLPLSGVGVGALNPIVLPVTIVLGLGAGWWMARTRKQAADKQHVRQWLTDAIADARSNLDQLVAEQLIEAEQQLALVLDDALSKRVEAIDAELRDVDKALRMDAAERGREIDALHSRLTEVRSGKDQSEQLLRDIRDLRDTPSSE